MFPCSNRVGRELLNCFVPPGKAGLPLHTRCLILLIAVGLPGSASCTSQEPDATKPPEVKQDNAMNKPYTPPEMPPFPADYQQVIKSLAPYYQDQRPLDFFFEMFVCDVIEELPQATKDALAEFSKRHPTFFSNHAGDWRAYVVSECKLSPTIETAIWDLWIRNSAKATSDGWTYHPWHYAQNFGDNYFADNSKVDVWEPGALEAARVRVAQHREQKAKAQR